MKILKRNIFIMLLLFAFIFTACSNNVEKNDVDKQITTNNDNTNEDLKENEDSQIKEDTETQEDAENKETNTSNEENTNETVYPLVIKDSYNLEVTIKEEPQRIISVAPSITEAIFALGVEDKLVGRTTYCDYPAETGSIETIGTLREPNIEKIAELQPDLVIASTHFKEEVYNRLDELGIKVVILYGEESFDGAYEVIEKLGEITNSNDKAKEVIKGMKEKVELVTTKVADKETPTVYYVVGYGEYGDYTAGKDTFIANMIRMAGGINAADDVEGWKYSIEKLIENDPDILICEEGNKDLISETNGYSELTAVKEGRIYEIDGNIVNRQGPRLADGLEELAKIIHPEVF